MQSGSENPQVLDNADAEAFLESKSFGRLAYAIGSHPEIVPINYCARGGKIYFRTSGGSKLFGVTINHNVAFEVDDMRDETARSVIVKGVARQLESAEDIEYVETLPLRPWIATDKFNYVEIEIEEMTGREFHMESEPCD